MHALSSLLMHQLFASGLGSIAGLRFLVAAAAPAGGDKSFGKLSPTFFDDLLNEVIDKAQLNAVVLLKDGFHLLNILLLIMVVWKCLQLALKQASFSELIGELFSLIWMWGMAAWFLHDEASYKMLTGYINNGFDYIGYKLATGSGPNTNDPHYMTLMLTKGEGVILGAINHIWQHVEEMFDNGNVPAILALVDGLMNVFTIIILLFAGMYFFIVFASSQVLIYIALSLGPIFIPWLMTPVTKSFFFNWLKFTCIAGMYKVMGMLIAVFGGALLDWVNTRIKDVVATANKQLSQTPCDSLDNSAGDQFNSNWLYQALNQNNPQNLKGVCNPDAADPTKVQGDMMLGVIKNDLAYIVIAMLLAWMMQQIPGWANGIMSGSARVSGTPLSEFKKAKQAAFRALKLATKAMAIATGVGGIAAAGELMTGGWKKLAKSAAGRGMNAAGRHMDRSSALMNYYVGAGKDITKDALMDRVAAWRQRAGEQGTGGDNGNPPENPPNGPSNTPSGGGTPGGGSSGGSGSSGEHTASSGAERTTTGGDGSNGQEPAHRDEVNDMLQDPNASNGPASGETPAHRDEVNDMLQDPNASNGPASGETPAHRDEVNDMLQDPNAPAAPTAGDTQAHRDAVNDMVHNDPNVPPAPTNEPQAAGQEGADLAGAAAAATLAADAAAGTGQGPGQAAAAPPPPETQYRGGKPFKTSSMRPAGTVGGYQTYAVDGPARPRAGYHLTYWPDGTPRDIKIDGYENDFEKGLQKMHPDDQAKIQSLGFVTDPAEYARQAQARGYDAHTGLPNDHPVASRHDPENRPGLPGNVGHRQFDNVREGPDHPVHGQTWITREGSMSFQRTWDGRAVSAWLTQHPEISSRDLVKALQNPKEYGLNNMSKFHIKEALGQLAAEKNYKAPPASQLPPRPPWLLKQVPPAAAARQFRQAVVQHGRRTTNMPSSRQNRLAAGNYRQLGKQTQDRQAGALARHKQGLAVVKNRSWEHGALSKAMRSRGLQRNTPKPGQKVKYANISGNALKRTVDKMGRQIARYDKKNKK